MKRLALVLVLFALAGGARAEMEGPFQLVDKASCITTGLPPLAVCAPLAGSHYIVSAAFYAAHADVLAPYRDASQVDLQDVYAGDDPHAPAVTVALTFPDQATAAAMKLTLGLQP